MKIYTWFINNLFLYTLGATINFIYTLGEAHHICQFVISLSLLGPSQSQIAGQGKFPSTCFAYNTAGGQISQNTPTSGASLTESGKTTLQFMYYAKCT